MKDRVQLLEDLRKKFSLDEPFTEKLLQAEELTMLCQEEGNLQQKGLLEKHEHLSLKNLPCSFADTTFRLRTLLQNLNPEELAIVAQYLGDDFWFPSARSAGSY